MAITREMKERRMASIHQIFVEAPFFVLTNYSGISAAHMDKLRSSLTQSGASMLVVKNTLARKALSASSKERQDYFLPLLRGGAIAVAWSLSDDFVHIPKILENFRKDVCLDVSMIAGCAGEQTFDKSVMKELSQLPPLDILRGNFVALLMSPMSRLRSALNAPSILLRVLAAKIDKESKEGQEKLS